MTSECSFTTAKGFLVPSGFTPAKVSECRFTTTMAFEWHFIQRWLPSVVSLPWCFRQFISQYFLGAIIAVTPYVWNTGFVCKNYCLRFQFSQSFPNNLLVPGCDSRCHFSYTIQDNVPKIPTVGVTTTLRSEGSFFMVLSRSSRFILVPVETL